MNEISADLYGQLPTAELADVLRFQATTGYVDTTLAIVAANRLDAAVALALTVAQQFREDLLDGA